ncbi:PIN domain-containing protein [Crenothrix polyspora]|uniref:Nucleotide-binding protein, PIN domain-containing protein n=1 Tax=Crenothrix polyspora TaxID=360316 RepID=A0A1R4HFA4_9GAMM|nr:PIN domain-containing protein [Crenothrix polyspora]SJM94902.1 Nucleotide-binding protein, PIN domain-containing protein [Crenothrix polyspora]
MTAIIVDTNIVFSALVNKNSKIASFLLEPNQLLVMPKFGFVELFKHKEKICSISKHSQDEILEILYQLIRHIDFYDENSISVNTLKKAWEIVKDVDPKDMLFVALTLELNGLLWTGDNKLRAGLKNKGFDAFFETN